jgi:GGDEF domain-containing protein
MISIKRFLEQRGKAPGAERDLVEATMQMGRLLLDAIADHMVRGNEADFRVLSRTLNRLARKMDGPQSAMSLLGISSDAVEAFETHCQRTTQYFREQNEEMQSMVAMLTDTVADLSGQTDASVDRLQKIERQVAQASELDDIRTLRANLEESLRSLREAAAQERSSSAATVKRLQDQIETAQKRVPEDPRHSRPNYTDIDLTPEPCEGPAESTPTAYVAAFRLQRAEHIASRFGDAVKMQMLTTIGTQLKTLLGPTDRLLRWKGTSFVMFIYSTDAIKEIRSRISGIISTVGQQYIEVGRKSAMLSVGVDWILFPQSDRPSLEAVFTEVDAFLANAKPESSSPVVTQRGSRLDSSIKEIGT